MKKSILLVAMLSLMVGAFAQEKKNIFNIEYRWMKMVGFSYQHGYPYGFSLAGGSFMSVGFGDGNKFDISSDATGSVRREPTWSMRFGWIGYNFDKDVTGWGAISFRPMFVMGFNKAEELIYDNTGNLQDKEGHTYFTMAPTLVVNVYFLHFSVGYEIVPKFKEINGLNFGVGLSIPFNSDEATKQVEKRVKKYN